MSMSRAWSATIRFKRWFSFSSSLRCLASLAFIPPYWFRHRCQVDSVISRWRATSSMLLPSPRSLSPSASLRMICSGVCFRFFMAVLSSFPNDGGLDSHGGWISSGGSGQRDVNVLGIEVLARDPLNRRRLQGREQEFATSTLPIVESRLGCLLYTSP